MTTKEAIERAKQENDHPSWWRRLILAVVNSVSPITGMELDQSVCLECRQCGAMVDPDNAERHWQAFHGDRAE